MKSAIAIIIIFSTILILAGTQNPSAAEKEVGANEISSSEPHPSSNKHLRMGTPYLEKGLLYLGITGILLVIWLLLRYKV